MRHGNLSNKPELAKKIKKIRDRIDEARIPATKVDENLIIGTWNIREFGRKRRRQDAIHLTAEIISQFDVIALTEVRDKLGDLARVFKILGGYWGVVYSDYRTDHAGNSERIAYVYDKRVVKFTGLAAEADPPRTKNRTTGVYELDHEDWWRSPYLVAFTAGNFDFVMMAVHIRWGSRVSDRARAIEHLADWIHQRRSEPGASDRDFVVVGDFNIPSRRSSTFRALTKHDLQVPSAMLRVRGTNLSQSKIYDQIVHTPTNQDRFTNKGGIIKFYKTSHRELFPDLTKEEFTYQLSDHLPLWIEMNTWIEDEQLDRVLQMGG